MSLVQNERAKLTANYLNAAAGSCLAAGVIAPLAAAVFRLTGAGSAISALTLAVGVLIFLFVSVAVHLAGVQGHQKHQPARAVARHESGAGVRHPGRVRTPAVGLLLPPHAGVCWDAALV